MIKLFEGTWAVGSEAEQRPLDEPEYERRFGPRARALKWLDPSVLLDSARVVVLSSFFETFSDKREGEVALQGDLFDATELVQGSEGWFDFVSDVGDGFGATYGVASALAKLNLTVATETNPEAKFDTKRGALLVMGGDEVYPSANFDRYRAKTVGPYTAALPPDPQRTPPMLFALPGNHDWYDGLTSFMRIFCSRGWIGGWRTPQQRSYFAIKLHERLWLWAFDSQFDSYIDSAQLAYFERARDALSKDDRVVLVTAKPSWVHVDDPADAPQSWQTLAFIEEKLIRAKGARLVTTLTGDIHHYCRYEQSCKDAKPPQKLTAGGGGAALSTTHGMPDGVQLPDYEMNRGQGGHAVAYARKAIWPKIEESKRMRWNALYYPPLLFRAPRFAVLLGAIYALFALLLASAVKDGAPRIVLDRHDFFSELLPTLGDGVRFSSATAAGLLLVALLAFARPASRSALTSSLRVAAAIVHWLAHMTLIVLATETALILVCGSDTSISEHATYAIWIAGVAGFAAGFLMGPSIVLLYMVLGNAVSRQRERFATEVDASLSDYEGRGYKNFLRLRVAENEGGELELTIYPIGIRQTPSHDEPEYEAHDGQWFDPGPGLSKPELIEKPITVSLK